MRLNLSLIVIGAVCLALAFTCQGWASNFLAGFGCGMLDAAVVNLLIETRKNKTRG